MAKYVSKYSRHAWKQMGAAAVIPGLDQNDMNVQICAVMPSGRRLGHITIPLMTACLFTYRPQTSLNQCTAACWHKSSARKLNQAAYEGQPILRKPDKFGFSIYCEALFFIRLFHFPLFSNTITLHP